MGLQKEKGKTIDNMACSSNPYLRPYASPLNLGGREVKVIQRLREFFLSKGFVERYFDNRLSILAACEDPFNVSTYDYVGLRWPHAQMRADVARAQHFDRQQRPWIFLRHKKQPRRKISRGRAPLCFFSLFEFEFAGGKEDLISLVKEMLLFLGYPEDGMQRGTYESKAREYGVKTLENEHEARMCEEKPVFS